MESFGERLKILIKSSDLKSIKKFSEKSHFSAVAVSNVINGKSKPSFDFITACLNVLPKVDLNWLIAGQGIAEKLEMENRHLREEIELQEKRLGTIAKPSSSRVSSQQTRLAI
ncbi:helix-turn-helix domain-containing protein [Saccharicrinis sp. GN24d3]|uniref:helix-turn-helix domain-containing protein n=1 Tax=Saccharicrinis sp. GN24d3 TaxID=3458416 RepID=UPI004037531C